MQKKKNKHDIWKKLRFKYRISATNENTLEEIWKTRFSIFSGISIILIFAAALITLTSVIIIATPIRYYLPGYLDAEVREKALRSALRIDSMEQRMRAQNLYLSNIQDILSGNITIDSIGNAPDTIFLDPNNQLLNQTANEKNFNQRYEEEERYNLSVLPPSLSSTGNTGEAFIFFKPVRGIVEEKFNPLEDMYGIKIIAQAKENVSSIFEGTVMYTGYDLNSGYIIQIQHNNGFVSLYKNNSILLKKVGDKVRTGEAISVINSSDNNTENVPLYMELWYRGNPVNPEEYITF